jgi:type VI secretion system secreted protein VgrG
MARRSLSTAERSFAQNVFSGSIWFPDVRVQDDLGFGNRPWTSPPTIVYNKYILHVGPDFYPNMLASNDRKRLLIHELAHVWQGQHGVPAGYVLNSAVHQTISGLLNGGDVAPAYSYSTGLKWRFYNCEQQASIVEDWYAAGSSTSNSRYVYICNNVRTGNPWA